MGCLSCFAVEFQHTAARRRLELEDLVLSMEFQVSTHSRPKAAGNASQWRFDRAFVSTHSRPKAAGPVASSFISTRMFQHTAARRRLVPHLCKDIAIGQFQHTAARRRLATNPKLMCTSPMRFQHTAARRRLGSCTVTSTVPIRFNTQPPEGGWLRDEFVAVVNGKFQHTAARRRLGDKTELVLYQRCFNTQPPEGGWSLSQKPCSIRFRSPNFAKLPRKAEMRV